MFIAPDEKFTDPIVFSGILFDYILLIDAEGKSGRTNEMVMASFTSQLSSFLSKFLLEPKVVGRRLVAEKLKSLSILSQ